MTVNKSEKLTVLTKLLLSRKMQQHYILLIDLAYDPMHRPLGQWSKLVDARVRPLIDNLVVIYP